MGLQIDILPRTLHFKQPAGTSRGIYTERRLWYVRLTSADNPQLFGLGECAPLFDLSAEYNDDYERVLHHEAEKWNKEGAYDEVLLRNYPSILFGFETAILSAKASLRGNYLRLYDTSFTRAETGIRINGLVWMGNYDEMLQRMHEKLSSGFKCIKIKIGAIAFDEELRLIQLLRKEFDRNMVEIRVDANGGFPPEEAPKIMELLSKYDIHSIEQPIRQGQWDSMATICNQSQLPVALDEELIGVNDTSRKADLLDTVRPNYLVLKPTLHGGLKGCEEWMALARERGIGYWVTSALESNVGLNVIAQWVSYLMEIHPKDFSDYYQGLGTGQLFIDNFNDTSLFIKNGALWMS